MDFLLAGGAGIALIMPPVDGGEHLLLAIIYEHVS